MDATLLFWKGMPERTFVHTDAKPMPGLEVFKNRLIVLLGGHVAGCKGKPSVAL